MTDTSEEWDPDAETRPGWEPKTPKEERGPLNKAPLATLRATPMSQQAFVLMGELAGRYPRPQAAKGAAYARKKTSADHANAVGAFIADLLAAVERDRSEGWIRCSLKKSDYTSGHDGAPGVPWRMFDAVRLAFTEAGLVEHKQGYPGSYSGLINPGPRDGKLTRYRATPALLAACASHGVTPDTLGEHFRFEAVMPAELVRLTAPSRKTPDTERAQRLRAQVAAVNSFAAQHTLAHPNREIRHLGWVRLFHRADHPGFRWDKGGRLFSHPQDATCYQRMRSKERRALIINEEAVVEIDISSAYLTIFYSWCGQQLDTDTDAYGGILGDTDMDREVAKCWINMSFGGGQLRTRWTTEIKENLLDRLARKDISPEVFDPKAYPMKRIREHVLQRHPILERWGGAIDGRVRDWSDLMFIESEVIIGTMQALMVSGIPSYPIHDSIIVPRSKEAVAVGILTEKFRSRAGVVPKLGVSRPEPLDF
ncbi:MULTISPECIES: hypothetical protein [unclassified Bradyrhizobium]|uniref:hypothetical protein n=1 Tax=unclassified Bradyrhizobium TaxID=2631580 RepID=UPI001FF9C657|nr:MULTISPECIES: hypothetical protein [unclassified Bradyrhizobium]MCK1712022.1 hypothetical protein [Bradyrhizobium sp. 143]